MGTRSDKQSVLHHLCAGTVWEVKVKVGQAVKAGETLVSGADQPLRQSVAVTGSQPKHGYPTRVCLFQTCCTGVCCAG